MRQKPEYLALDDIERDRRPAVAQGAGLQHAGSRGADDARDCLRDGTRPRGGDRRTRNRPLVETMHGENDLGTPGGNDTPGTMLAATFDGVLIIGFRQAIGRDR